jgi:transcriptional regulator with XRE-family HTH domain
MKDLGTINAAIGRNLAFWRRMQGYTLGGGVFLNTGVRASTLAAYESGEKPALAAHLLQLGKALGVPVALLGLDLGEEFYQTAERHERWLEAWGLLLDVEEQGRFEAALNALTLARDAGE